MSNCDLDVLVKQNYDKNLPYPLVVLCGDEVIKVRRQEDDSLDSHRFVKAGRVCKRVLITEITTDLVTHEKTCVLEFINTAGQKEIIKESCDVLADTQKCIRLAKYGVDVDSINCKDVIRHLKNQMACVTVSRVTKEMGFRTIGGKQVFVGSKAYGIRNGKIVWKSISYVGKMLIVPKGNYGDYRAMLEQYVIPNPLLSVALAIGASSLLVGYLWEDLQIPNLMVQISGESSTGKSTALMLALSLYGGMANVGEKTSLFSSWNATDNALVEMLAGNYGIAVGLDEAGMSRSKKFAPVIYTLAEGKEKQRMDINAGNRDVREWHTTIISTGEIPLTDVTDQATGQKVRLINFPNVPWTENAEQSEQIKQVISANYGFLGTELAKSILRKGKDYWLELHEKETQKLMRKLQCGSLSKRTANQLALIVMAAKLIKCKGLDLDVKLIREFLCEITNENLGDEEMLGERAYECFKAEVSSRTNQIERRAMNGKVYHAVIDGKVWACSHSHTGNSATLSNVSIPKTTLDEFLLNKGFRNADVVYEQWKEKGQLAKNAQGGIIHRVSIGGVDKVKCLKVIL